MANIDVEGPSTSIGPSEILPGMRGEHGAMGEAPPVEIIRYQPAQVVECHCHSSTSGGTGGTSTAPAPTGSTPAVAEDAASAAHSSSADGESAGELQSLVPKQQQEVTVEISGVRAVFPVAVEEDCAHKPHCSKCRHDCAAELAKKSKQRAATAAATDSSCSDTVAEDNKDMVLDMGRETQDEGDCTELEALMAKEREGQPDHEEATV